MSISHVFLPSSPLRRGMKANILPSAFIVLTKVFVDVCEMKQRDGCALCRQTNDACLMA